VKANYGQFGDRRTEVKAIYASKEEDYHETRKERGREACHARYRSTKPRAVCGRVHAVRLLLDTHAFLWFLLDDPELSGTAKALIEDMANDVKVSVVPQRAALQQAFPELCIIDAASRSIFSLFSPEEEIFANSLLWKNLLLRTCLKLL